MSLFLGGLIEIEQLIQSRFCFCFVLMLCNTAKWWVFWDFSLSFNNIPQKQPGNTSLWQRKACNCEPPAGREYSFWLTCLRNYKDHRGTDGKKTSQRTRNIPWGISWTNSDFTPEPATSTTSYMFAFTETLLNPVFLAHSWSWIAFPWNVLYSVRSPEPGKTRRGGLCVNTNQKWCGQLYHTRDYL